ncbi:MULTISPECIES: alkaline phosphatase PhoX [unclassified Crossiella]|uniref:alkaline phosphatase PhoX n=1 Tax=unclassified Crossiella TaxID=2620835 RepID=UPI0020002E70|nr:MULTISPECIES: alkaline phosphatase PhoX [unclassified Crossiella]MCK2237173.1 PhoX family protein [Crossiella sp. S99.2]MCK2250828.1 PhoX family protein [Crossiella sp. S99.1]
MERRNFLRVAVVGAAAAAFGGAAWRDAFADGAQPGASPYGPLLAADGNGIQLPQGFTSRVIARTGQQVTGTGYTWHPAPDGGACFADGSGWIYVSNSEVSSTGGVGAVKFNASGQITGAYRTLANTNVNCAGGATPWNTWLSCEEVDRGYVYETDPWGVKAAIRRPAMGRFKHEACAADPDHGYVYLTEDVSDGCFYRFKPTIWGDLSAGTLEVLKGTSSQTSGPVTWGVVGDVDGSPTATRNQVVGAKRFNGGEGCYYAGGTCWFTTKGDNRVWAYNAGTSSISLTYDDNLVTGGAAPLTGVDNVTGTSSGDLFVAEDGGNMEICIITPAGIVAPFLRITGQSGSEITGPAFSPAGNRLYFSSQRGTSGSSSGGITYEVTGPFRT